MHDTHIMEISAGVCNLPPRQSVSVWLTGQHKDRVKATMLYLHSAQSPHEPQTYTHTLPPHLTCKEVVHAVRKIPIYLHSKTSTPSLEDRQGVSTNGCFTSSCSNHGDRPCHIDPSVCQRRVGRECSTKCSAKERQE